MVFEIEVINSIKIQKNIDRRNILADVLQQNRILLVHNKKRETKTSPKKIMKMKSLSDCKFEFVRFFFFVFVKGLAMTIKRLRNYMHINPIVVNRPIEFELIEEYRIDIIRIQ